ncbi:hypothetical protein [Catenulispora rubra]|uniref:hypothetical protein n=1 Tax=Catenulispora rubra TaxID=280293 RepID=UPI0018923EF0|nr:hypothetical protein [Catenulispora rubra]
MSRTLPDRGRSPAEIDADVQHLQEGIRRAATAVEAADPDGPGPNREDYHEAVAAVTRATRDLVDYEAHIPELERRHRIHLAVRTARRAYAGVIAVGAGLCAVGAAGVVTLWWIALAVPLLFGGIAAVPGTAARAAGPGFRPRVGAGMFALAAGVAVLTCAHVLTGWASPVAPLAVVVGLWAFRVFAGPAPVATA